MTDLDATARREEERYVHQVYESIAEHFSRTRYKVSLPGLHGVAGERARFVFFLFLFFTHGSGP